MWPMIKSHKSTSVHKNLLAIRNQRRCYPLKGSSPRAVEEFAGRELAGVGSREKVLVHSLPKLRKDTVLNVFIVHVLHSPAEPDLTFKSDTKVATRPATGPGSRLPSTAPPVGTTGVVSKETTYVPAQTAAKAPEHTYPALQDTPG